MKMKKIILQLLFLAALGAYGQNQNQEDSTKLEKNCVVSNALPDSIMAKDPGHFSLRFAYCMAKDEAKKGYKKPSNMRHILHNMMAKAIFYFENNQFDSTEISLSELEKKLDSCVKCKRIQVGKMTLYNIMTEVYLALYKKTNDFSYLEKAEQANKKVFDVENDDYPEVGDETIKQETALRENIKEEKEAEYEAAMNNVHAIVNLIEDNKKRNKPEEKKKGN